MKKWQITVISSLIIVGLFLVDGGATYVKNLLDRTSSIAATRSPATLRFVFDFTRRPTDYGFSSSDRRDLAACFDYVQLFGRNSSTLKVMEFTPNETSYLGEGWYKPEMMKGLYYTTDSYVSWAGRESELYVEVPEEAHFLRVRAGSIGRTKYLMGGVSNGVGYKQLAEDPQRMRVYFNNSLVDEVVLYSKMQIFYVTLKTDQDSDGDGIINKSDPNPRIPEPRPINLSVNVAVHYMTAWGMPYNKTADWSYGTPFTPLLGLYESADSDVVDWHIKWAAEHGIRTFIFNYPPFPQKWTDNLDDMLLRSRYLRYISFFAMLYGWFPGERAYGGTDKISQLIDGVKNFADYVNHPRYLRIAGTPLVELFQMGIYQREAGDETFSSVIGRFRAELKRAVGDVFLVGCAMGVDLGKEKTSAADLFAKHFDGISFYDMPHLGADASGLKAVKDERGRDVIVAPYDTMVDGTIGFTRGLAGLASRNSKKLIPSVSPGFNNIVGYNVGWDNYYTNRYDSTPEKFGRMCSGIESYIDPNLKMVIVEAWNEFQEGSVIEPTKEFGFSYLKVIRDLWQHVNSR